MRLETTAGQLRASLRLFRGIVHGRNAIPVLGMVRLADGIMSGTDLDMELCVTLPSIGAMEGAGTVDYSGLAALAGCLDADETVTVAESGNLATVAFNGSTYRMASCAVADYPGFGAVEGSRTAAGNLGLVAALRRIRFAMPREETRYYLNGAALQEDPEGRALVVATDGHRLAMLPIGAMPEGARGAILPSNMVHWLCAQKREPETVDFAGVEPGSDKARLRAVFAFAGMTLSAKLVNGTFPDVFRFMPRDPQPVFATGRAPLLRALNRMRSFTPGINRGLKLASDGGVLTLTLAARDEGRAATETLPVDGGASAPFECGFNADYLISALAELRGERVTFASERGDMASGACLITCADDDLRVVQMPMRV